jgi:hypothetical protein
MADTTPDSGVLAAVELALAKSVCEFPLASCVLVLLCARKAHAPDMHMQRMICAMA